MSRGCAAISSASWSARMTCAPGPTISVIRPIDFASGAWIVRPVSTRSSARPVPITRGSRCVPPSISGTPQRRSAQPNDGVGGGDAQVAPQRELEAAGEAVAGDGGDRGLGGDEAREAERAAGRVGVERLDRLQVGAGAERLVARAREDEDRGVIVGLEAVEGVEQGLRRVAVDGVVPLRPVDRDERRRLAALVVDHQPPRTSARARRAFSAYRGGAGGASRGGRTRSRGS